MVIAYTGGSSALLKTLKASPTTGSGVGLDSDDLAPCSTRPMSPLDWPARSVWVCTGIRPSSFTRQICLKDLARVSSAHKNEPDRLTSRFAEVENPRELLGIPYRDLTLTSPDAVKIRAFLIPALQPSKAQSLVSAHRNKKLERERKEKAGEAHIEETEDERSSDGWVGPKRSESDDDWAKKRPTVIMYHANAGKPRSRWTSTSLR